MPPGRALEVVCIGAGYVGGPTMAVLADQCGEERVNVTVADVDAERIAAWNSAELPIYEPGLEGVIARRLHESLHFTTDVDGAIKKADVIFISVRQPRGAGLFLALTWLAEQGAHAAGG